MALTWLSVALGLVAKTPESASNLPMFLVLLPFLSSGFVPTESLPGPLRWFAENEPFTPTIETIRGLLLGTPSGRDVAVAIGWSVGIALGSLPVGAEVVRPAPDPLTQSVSESTVSAGARIRQASVTSSRRRCASTAASRSITSGQPS